MTRSSARTDADAYANALPSAVTGEQCTDGRTDGLTDVPVTDVQISDRLSRARAYTDREVPA